MTTTTKTQKSKAAGIIPIRCLIMRDKKGEWSAVALELDVWGFGKTKDAARQELEMLVETQVAFAINQDAINALAHPADKKWFKLWEQMEKNADKLPSGVSGYKHWDDYHRSTYAFKKVA